MAQRQKERETGREGGERQITRRREREREGEKEREGGDSETKNEKE